jgi:hypothetical protein
MDDTHVPAWSDLSDFKTPVRVLAQQFLASRKRWKAKYKALHEKATSYRIRLRDLRRSRDHWKQKAKALAQEIAKERRPSRKKQGTGHEPASTAAVPPRAQS